MCVTWLSWGFRRTFTYAELQNTDKNIRLAKDSYGFQYWQEDITSVGYYLGKNEDGKSKWSFDPIDHAYEDMDGSEQDNRTSPTGARLILKHRISRILTRGWIA